MPKQIFTVPLLKETNTPILEETVEKNRTFSVFENGTDVH